MKRRSFFGALIGFFAGLVGVAKAKENQSSCSQIANLGGNESRAYIIPAGAREVQVSEEVFGNYKRITLRVTIKTR